MRKLIPYIGNAFAFYKDVISGKKNTVHDPTFKDRLNGMEGIIQPLFQTYDDRFAGNNLEILHAHPLTASQRADLLKLYSYKSSRLQKLKIQLTTMELNKALNTCQCCTIGEVGSFDHLVPKEEFPEFSVNPKNLFPACQKCNSYKHQAWRQGGVRTFLNLFLDELPTVQYLFANLNVDATGLVTVAFELRNVNGVSAQMFALLQSHFINLRLLQRFKEHSDTVIVPIVNSIKSGKVNLTKPQIIAQIKATSIANQAFFGANYWKSILEIALADSQPFIDSVYDNP
jgi:5-methylcytosine-specific restriction endonuclease McrA